MLCVKKNKKMLITKKRICRENVGRHAIVFKSLHFDPFTLKRKPGVFKLNGVCSVFKSLCFRPRKHRSSVNQCFPTWGAPEFTAGAREQIYFEVGLGDKTLTIII